MAIVSPNHPIIPLTSYSSNKRNKPPDAAVGLIENPIKHLIELLNISLKMPSLNTQSCTPEE
jgi:hypothetical protein